LTQRVTKGGLLVDEELEKASIDNFCLKRLYALVNANLLVITGIRGTDLYDSLWYPL